MVSQYIVKLQLVEYQCLPIISSRLQMFFKVGVPLRCLLEYYEILQLLSYNVSGGCFCPLPVLFKIILWWLLLPFARTFRNSY